MAEMRPMDTRQSFDDGKDVKVAGSGMTLSTGTPRTVWNVSISFAR